MAKRDNDDALFGAMRELDLENLDRGPKAVSTGFPQLDKILNGGLPNGKISQFIGEPDTWKSGLNYQAMGNAQRLFPDKVAVLADTEFVIQSQDDLDWLASRGVITSKDRLEIIQGNTAEEIYNKLLEVSSRSDVCYIGIDSLGNMEVADNVNVKRFEKNDKNKTKDDRVGIFAKVTGASFKLLAGNVARNRICMVVVNQVRDNLSMYGGGAFNTPGGRAYKHNLSVSVELYRKETIKNGDDVIGAIIKAVVKRSKIGVAGQTNEENHLHFFNKGAAMSEVYNLYNQAVDAGIIVKAGAWFKSVELDKKWQGRDRVYAEIEESEDLRNRLKELIENETN